MGTARQYVELMKQPRKGHELKQLLQPWRLSTLQEHETCFQQWTVLQLYIGIVATLVIFCMSFIWFLAEEIELARPPLGSIIVNALVGLLLTVFLTHLAWYGVTQKHGCCCLVLCCCLGKPVLLVVAFISVLLGVLAVVSVVQALGSAHGALVIVVLISAFFALLHGISLLYIGFEAFMVWKLCAPETKPSSASTEVANKHTAGVVVGAARTVGENVADIEAAAAKTET